MQSAEGKAAPSSKAPLELKLLLCSKVSIIPHTRPLLYLLALDRRRAAPSVASFSSPADTEAEESTEDEDELKAEFE